MTADETIIVHEYECDGCGDGYPKTDGEAPAECHSCGCESFTMLYTREVEQ